MPKPDDQARLRHMLDASRDAISFAQDKTLDDLATNRMLSFALVHAIEIVGEAAARITRATQEQHPEIPWADVIGMRHRLAHGYYDIDLELVWLTIKDDLPHLVSRLESIC